MNPRALFLFLVVAAVSLGVMQSSRAATFIIPDGDVAGLKNAINTSNSNGATDTIELATNGTYTLLTSDNVVDGLPPITADGGKELTIQGHNSILQRSVAPGTPDFRILEIGQDALVTISDLTIRNGHIGGEDSNFPDDVGGAIYNYYATLTLNHCTVSDNWSFSSGGGIYSNGFPFAGVTSVTINDCIFTGNSGSSGGGIVSNSGDPPGLASLTINNSIFNGNSGFYSGGAIRIGAGDAGNSNLTIANSVLSNNSVLNPEEFEGSGGAIEIFSWFGGTATVLVSGSTISGNSCNFGGGGINSQTGDNSFEYSAGTVIVVVENSTISDNSADRGGGIRSVASLGNATLIVRNSTLRNNSAVSKGGAIWSAAFHSSSNATVDLTSSTLCDNSASNGCSILNSQGGKAHLAHFEIENTILKTGASGENIYNFDGTGTSRGHNLSNDNGAGFLNASTDQILTDPKLDPSGLQNNGGATKTVALLPTSPAINTGAAVLARDQRGYFRNGPSDIGAFEFNGGLLGRSGITRAGNHIVISAEVVRGKTYRLERKLSLTDASWQSIPGVVDLVATGNDTESITDPNALSLGRAFYHFTLVP
jgi:hypothetical protein